jgi:hypothetical protein
MKNIMPFPFILLFFLVFLFSCERSPDSLVSNNKESSFTVNELESSPNCEPVCVRTPGYWKNHPEAWPVDEITIGGVPYTKDGAIAEMNKPVRNDKSLTMFKAFVAAYLNWKNGADVECIMYSINEAIWWLAAFPPGSEVAAKSEAWQYSHGEAIYDMLDKYNNGRLCAPACD